jgi:hypothetical protein
VCLHASCSLHRQWSISARLGRVGAGNQRAEFVDADDRGVRGRAGVQVDDGCPFGTKSGSFDTAHDRTCRHRAPSATRIRRTCDRPTRMPSLFAASVNASNVHTTAVDVSSAWTSPSAAGRRRYQMGSIYSLELPPIRPALSARAYVSRSNRGSSPVASVVAIYSSIRR